MDFGLSDEQKMIVDTVETLSKKKFIHLRVRWRLPGSS